jgi:hypothetical protein
MGMWDQIPHFSTIRQWFIRFGVWRVERMQPKATDWICIGDITIDLGTMKCLTLLGIRKCALDQKKNYRLTHADVEIIGLFPTRSSTGEFVYNAFKESSQRLGSVFKTIVLDQGSDIGKGARLYIAENPNTKIIHDISHKLSLEVERVLKNDQRWQEYKKMLRETINAVKQSAVAALSPPSKRGKDRYMDIKNIIYWPEKIWECLKKKDSTLISKEQYQKYYKWTEDFKPQLKDWQYMYEVTCMIKDLVRDYGYSKEVLSYVVDFLKLVEEKESLKTFAQRCVKALAEEVNKLGENEVVLGSTEVLESIFGKFKEINRKSRGISGNILSMSSYVGSEYTEKDVKEAMEGLSIKKAMIWIKEKVGETLTSLRRRAFKKIKGTKFDSEMHPVF